MHKIGKTRFLECKILDRFEKRGFAFVRDYSDILNRKRRQAYQSKSRWRIHS